VWHWARRHKAFREALEASYLPLEDDHRDVLASALDTARQPEADDQRPGGKRVGCADCGLCFGADRVIDTDRETPSALQALTRGPKHIGIVVHGAWSGDFNPMARLAS